MIWLVIVMRSQDLVETLLVPQKAFSWLFVEVPLFAGHRRLAERLLGIDALKTV